MTRSLLSCLLLLCLTITMTACGGEEDDNAADNNKTTSDIPELTNPFAGQADAATAGEMIYAQDCIFCHGADGSPTTSSAKDLRVTSANATDGYIYTVLEKGGAGVEGVATGMPAYGNSKSDDELWQLVTHIRTFKAE